MSKPSRRPGREEQKQQRRERQRAQRELRERQQAQGLAPPKRPSVSNQKSPWRTLEAERAARQETIEVQASVFRTILPKLLGRLAQITDPRNPKTVKHKLTVVLLYGLLCFVYQMASRREANRQMSQAQFEEHLRLLFPELESLPHADTLQRLLQRIDVEQIQEAQAALMRHFLRNKKFQRYVVQRCYLIAVDGTQKFVRERPWTAEALQRQRAAGQGGQTQYYVYVLEANLVLNSGVSLPLLSEFLEYPDGDVAEAKQDCESKAFKRLAARLKTLFPHLRIMLLLDGLYPTGPMFALCRRYGWEFMMVLQDKCLPSVWHEFEGLSRLEPEQTLDQAWGDRLQHFRWANDIRYEYGPNGRRKQTVHVAVCEERWEEIAPDSTESVQKKSRHAWISSQPLSRKNVHDRCNLAARHRWAIESNILVEKRQGYSYEHVFSYDWTAMKGYHYLMRLAHLINTLVQCSVDLHERVVSMGIRAFWRFARETLTGPWLNAERIRLLVNRSHQLRLA